MRDIKKGRSIVEARDVIERLHQGDEALFREIYYEYRENFLSWAAHHYPLDRDQASDVYQEALSSFYINVYSGRLTELNASLKTYIFGIAKNHLYKRLQMENEWELQGLRVEVEVDDPALVDPYPEFNERRKEVIKAMEQMGEPCKTIIEWTYLLNCPNKTIMEELRYSSEDVVKSTKWRCMQRLWNQIRGK